MAKPVRGKGPSAGDRARASPPLAWVIHALPPSPRRSISFSMLKVSGIHLLSNAGRFEDPFELEVSFTCSHALEHNLEWTVAYAGRDMLKPGEPIMVLTMLEMRVVRAVAYTFVIKVSLIPSALSSLSCKPELTPSQADAPALSDINKIDLSQHVGTHFVLAGVYNNQIFTNVTCRPKYSLEPGPLQEQRLAAERNPFLDRVKQEDHPHNLVRVFDEPILFEYDIDWLVLWLLRLSSRFELTPTNSAGVCLQRLPRPRPLEQGQLSVEASTMLVSFHSPIYDQ